MSKKTFLKRYLLIIHLLRKRPASFEQIVQHLRNQSELDEENYEMSLRTFQRDVQDIASMYNIEITYNRSAKTYEISHDESDDRNERIMESFEVFNALNLSTQYARHILVEKRKPRGTEHLYGFLHAISNRVEVKFNHEKYWGEDEEKQKRHIQPLAIKEARYRWYVVARDCRDQKIKTFALDRISDLEITTQKFEFPPEFDAEKHFEFSFGIICEEEQKPQKVVLSFSSGEAKYIKSLPLHHSQHIISESDIETVFELRLHPTYDFVMELLSYGKEVTVLEPKRLKDEIVKKLQGALNNYEHYRNRPKRAI